MLVSRNQPNHHKDRIGEQKYEGGNNIGCEVLECESEVQLLTEQSDRYQYGKVRQKIGNCQPRIFESDVCRLSEKSHQSGNISQAVGQNVVSVTVHEIIALFVIFSEGFIYRSRPVEKRATELRNNS